MRDAKDLVLEGSARELCCNGNHCTIIFKSAVGENRPYKSTILIFDFKKGNCKERHILKEKMELFKNPA